MKKKKEEEKEEKEKEEEAEKEEPIGLHRCIVFFFPMVNVSFPSLNLKGNFQTWGESGFPSKVG